MNSKLLAYAIDFSSFLIQKIKDKSIINNIILFGSVAREEADIGSDIDIFILSNEKKELNLKEYEKKLETEIQIFLHTKKEFENMKKSNKGLLNNILNGIKLSGFLEVFKWDLMIS